LGIEKEVKMLPQNLKGKRGTSNNHHCMHMIFFVVPCFTRVIEMGAPTHPLENILGLSTREGLESWGVIG
jgi:hypothetical protein